MKEKLPRLLIILNRFVIGGQAVDTIPLAWYLKDNFDVLVLYGEKEKDEIEANFLLKQYPGLTLKKIGWLRRSINPFVDLVAFCQIIFTIVAFGPHIVHTHGAKSGLFGRLAAFLCRVPVVVHTFHGHLFHSYFSVRVSALIKFIERSLAKITSGFIILSNSQLTDLVNVFKIVPLKKSRIIALGMEPPVFLDKAKQSHAFRHRYNLQESDVAIGIVGRIVPIKNHYFFVEVIERLLHQQTKYRPAFFIIGDGELRYAVEKHLDQRSINYSANELSHDTRVVFTSWLSDINQFMHGLDIVALTSLNEGTPLSLIEAQAYGKPVLATNVGGVRDTMVHNSTGYCVDKNDLEGFCAHLHLLIDEPVLRDQMGQNGMDFINNKFSKQREVDQTKDFYLSLLGKK